MERLTARDFAPELLELYDFYVHGKLNRREFLDRAAAFTLCSMTAVAVLDALTPNYALAQQIAFTDPDIVAEYVRYPSPRGHGEVRAYLVRPAKAEGKVPGIVVVHENRGLNPYIEDVARRVAKAGFVALAPDGLSSVGGYPGNDEKGRELQARVDPHPVGGRDQRGHVAGGGGAATRRSIAHHLVYSENFVSPRARSSRSSYEEDEGVCTRRERTSL
mgnify:CR=1 FL=1